MSLSWRDGREGGTSSDGPQMEFVFVCVWVEGAPLYTSTLPVAGVPQRHCPPRGLHILSDELH